MRKSSRKRSGSPKMFALNIGENDPVGNKLVSIEMEQVAKMKFKQPKPNRDKSIQRIFGNMVKVDTNNKVAEARILEFLPPDVKHRLLLQTSPAVVEFESASKAAPPVTISMKSAARKFSFTPGIHHQSEDPSGTADDDDNKSME
jgi:hypothetical protein